MFILTLPVLSPVIQIMQRDCADHYTAGRRSNGIYRISPDPRNESFEVYCDMQTQGGGGQCCNGVRMAALTSTEPGMTTNMALETSAGSFG